MEQQKEQMFLLWVLVVVCTVWVLFDMAGDFGNHLRRDVCDNGKVGADFRWWKCYEGVEVTQ
jgi:hypothetical protein